MHTHYNARFGADSGRRIFLAVPANVRPGWAATLLELLAPYEPTMPPEVQELLQLIEDDKRWPEAHKQFSRIRELSLRQPQNTFLALAELVAKVTYNASNHPAPFDADAGWYIPALTAQLANRAADESLRRELRRVLVLHLPAAEHQQVDLLLAMTGGGA